MNTEIILLISGGVLFCLGTITGAIIMRKGIGTGNKLTLSSKDEIPIDEEIIPIEQDSTE